MSKKKNNLTKAEFEAALRPLHEELSQVQRWVVATGARIVIVFEGRDTAGKGGTIRYMTERVSPRVFRVVALPTPTKRQQSELYVQRYVPHLPSAGEVVIFDRSWYNRLGVEKVMGFCSDEEYQRALRGVPIFERALVEDGILLLKYFLDVDRKEQKKRLESRMEDPRKFWKLSDMDLESYSRWWQYTDAYNQMIAATDFDFAPWYRVNAHDKRNARLNCIAHILGRIPSRKIPFKKPKLPRVRKRPKSVPDEIRFARSVPEKY